jgi:hypothetical protein
VHPLELVQVEQPDAAEADHRRTRPGERHAGAQQDVVAQQLAVLDVDVVVRVATALELGPVRPEPHHLP